MGKGIRFLINLVCALVICFGLCSFTAYAEENTGDDAQESTNEEAAEPQDSEELEAESVDTVVKNAIQTQVEEAINNWDSVNECFVTVEEGTYDGNITLQKSNLKDLKNRVLYILTEDSYQTDEDGNVDATTISSGGAGKATVNGDIFIEGITVVLGGIYLSMGNKITVVESDTSIYGTTKDDNLSVDLGKNAKIKIDTGDGTDTIVLNGVSTDAGLALLSNTGSIAIELDGGDGADVYEIDTNVGGDLEYKSYLDRRYESPTSIVINGDELDRLHLVGTLQKGTVDNNIYDSTDSVSNDKTYVQKKSAGKYDVNLISEDGLKTIINAIGVGSFTDELENKATKDFTNGVRTVENKAFIDYLISLEKTTAAPITVNPAALADNVAHSFAQIKLGIAGGNVEVGDVTTNDMNLLIVGKTVDVKGNINTGKGNVIIRANASDAFNIDFSSMIPMPESLEDMVQSAVPNNGKASVFSIKSTASIGVEEGKTISGNHVDLKANNKQDQPLVPEVSDLLKGINFIAVKVGKAVVNLKGTIKAAGSLIGSAISNITTAASNEFLSDWFIPIAAGILLGEAGISVLGDITAKAIKLLSDSTVNLEVASTVGALPVSIAVAGITNDSKVEVRGSARLKADQNISMEATGKIKASTVSHAKNKEKNDEKGNKKGKATADGDGDGAAGAKTNGANTENGQTVDQSANLYGGFVSVSVAIQNIFAKVLENALLESAEGSINIYAQALESVLTSAISYVPETADAGEGEDGQGELSEADKENGKTASDEDTKSDKGDGDTSDKRSVENSKDSAASLLTAAGNTKEENQIGDKLDADDKNKIDNLKKGITGDEEESSSGEEGSSDEGESEEGEKKQEGIDKVFDEATKSADTEADATATTKKSSNQLAGALAVNVALNTSIARIDTTKFVKAATGAIKLAADAFTYSKAVANASQVQGSQDAEDEAKFAVGAAVAINVVNHDSIAEIKKGNIEANEIVVSANSGSEGMPVTAHTEAVAGHTDKSEYGIAGAVAVDVVSVKTKALVGENARLNVKEDGLTINAVSNEDIKTISTTNEELGESNAEVGVGVAISVNVCGVDTIAQIGSENGKTVINDDIASMVIDAANNLVEDVEATTGAAGKVGVSPSVTVVVSGANAESNAFFIPDTEITNLTGDYEQNATNNVERTVSADAKAESQNGGSGALIVTVLNDSAYAKGKSEINANNIKINAVSKSVLTKAHARASSKGAMKNGGKTDGDSDDGDADAGNGDGDQDKQADEAIAGAKSLSKNVGTKNVNENEVDKLTANRQKGQTAEGSVSVAAAFVVNVMSNESIAVFEVPVINAPETAIEVTSSNTTSAYVFADSSSVAAKCDSNGQVESGSSVGVGAAVAINVITIKNEAHIKTNGDIKAKDIRVTATNAIDDTYNYDVNTLKTYAVSGAGAGNVGVAGSVAIAVINGNVDAFIDCGNKTIYIVDEIGNIYIRGSIDNNEETIASAALLNGEADKNDKDNEGNEKSGTVDSKKTAGDDYDEKTDDGKAIAVLNSDKTGLLGKDDPDDSNPPKDSNNNPMNPNAKAGEEGKSSSVGVGASFALNYSTVETNAYINASKIEANWGVRIFAVENIDRYTFAVAGTDPVAKGASSAMNTVVDASVALLIESDRVNAYISGQSTINAFEVGIEAIHKGEARNQASGFAVGNQSAIGAAVAFIWSDSRTKANFDGVITAAALYINAETRDTDRSLALALAKGTTQEKAKPDSSAQPGTKNNDNKTAEKINTALNKTKSDKAEGEATNSKALSTNLLKTQNVKTESTSTEDSSSETGKAVKEAESTVNTEVTNKNQSGAGDNNISADPKGTESKKVDVAAAVGILVADHKAETSVAGKIYASEVTVKATNDATFSALGTAITMTQLPATAAVAIGVAVAVNKGEAIAKLADGIVIAPKKANEDGFFIIVSADIKQNCDNDYFGAQAVSGSVAKAQGTEDTKVAAAGAVAILITDAKAQAIIGNNANLKSSDINITATDDYRLYVRAGSLGYTNKAIVGIGISFGMLYANDRISASIGRNAVIECKSLTVEAVKVHENLLEGQGLKEYIDKALEVYDGISSNKTVTARGDGSNEEVVIADSDIKSIYTVQEATNIINIFVLDNYHVESFSGSAALGQGDFNGAGAVSFALLKTDVNAVIGENANIKLIKGSLNYGDFAEDDNRPKDVYVHASDKADLGLYTIGLVAANAKNTAGASISVLIDHSKVNVMIDKNAKITSEESGGLKIVAETDLNNLIVSVASAVSGNASGTSTVGGNINVFVTNHETKAQLHDGANVDVNGNIDIIADYANDTILVAAGVQGGKTGIAVTGGTLVVGIYKSDTEALAGSENGVKKTILKSRTGDVNVKANSIDKAVSVLASASAAIGSKAGVAAVIDVLISKARILAKIISKADITAQYGNINVIASSGTKFTAVDANVALASSGTAAGGTVQVGVFRRIVEAAVAKGCKLLAGGNVLISTYGDDRMLDILAAAAAGSQNAIDGVIVVSIEENIIRAILESDKNNASRIDADGSIGISSYLDSDTMLIAAGLNAAKTVAAGGTISTVILNNTIEAVADSYSSLYSGGLKALVIPSVTNGSKDKKKKIRGIAIDSGENSVFRLISAAGSISGKVGVEGVINTVVKSSKVHSYARGHNTLKAKVKEGSSSSDSDVPLDIQVVANSYNDNIDAAGSLSIGGTAGVGVSIVTFVNSEEVIAAIIDAEEITSEQGSIIVDANVKENILLVAVSLDGSATAAVGMAPNVLVYNNTVKAYITGKNRQVYANNDIAVTSAAEIDINMLAAVVSASGSVAVSLEGNVIYFNNNSAAYIGPYVTVTAKTGNVTIKSTTKETLNEASIGLSASGTAAVGGSVDVVISNINSNAYTSSHVTINSGGNTNIKAIDEYSFLGISGNIDASGTGALGVSAVVAVSYNMIKAQVGDYNVVNCTGNIIIEANSNRKFETFAATVGISDTIGAGGAVVVIVEGKGIDKDSHDAIYENGNIRPEDIVLKGYKHADKRAEQSYSKNNLYVEIYSSLDNTKGSAQTVANKGANGGKYDEYGYKKGGKELDTSIVVATSGNMSGRIEDASDLNMAYVGTNSVLTSRGNINILSNENVSAFVVAGGIGGGTAGIGAGVAVVMITSNVSALVDANTVLKAAGSIKVDATLTHEKGKVGYNTLHWNTKYRNKNVSVSANNVVGKANNSEKERTGSSSSFKDYGIFIVSGAAGAGYVGVGVNVSYYNNSANVTSLVKGSVISDNNVSVSSKTSLSNVGVFSVSLSGGFVGASVSVAIATNEANVIAGLDTSKSGAENSVVNGELLVNADNNTDLLTINGAFAAGAAGVSTIVSIANNKLSSEAYIGADTRIKAHDVKVKSEVQGDNEAYVANIAAGLGAATVTVVIANNRVSNVAHVGYQNHSNREAYISAKNLEITAYEDSSVYVYGMSVSTGGVDVNGAIALAINNASNNAALYDMNVNANKLSIHAYMNGDTKTEIGTISVSVVGVGAVVASSYINGNNKACVILDSAKLSVETLTVDTIKNGTMDCDMEAVAKVVTGVAGVAKVAVNYVYAINNAVNEASIDTASQINASRSIDVIAQGKSRAIAVAIGGAEGGLVGNVSRVEADLTGLNTAKLIVRKGSSVKTPKLNVLSIGNNENTKASYVNLSYSNEIVKISPDAAAVACIYAGNIAGLSITANFASAKSDMSDISSIELYGGEFKVENLTIKTFGASTAYAKSATADLALTEIGVVKANAISQGTFEAKWINKSNDAVIELGDIYIVNEYVTKANTLVNTFVLTVSLKVASLNVNEAVAKANSNAKAFAEGSLGNVRGNIEIISIGYLVEANSNITGNDYVVVRLLNFAKCITESRVEVTNKAYLDCSKKDIRVGNLSVKAELKKVKSIAKGGASSASYKISFVGKDEVAIKATSKVTNKAYINNANISATGTVSVRADVGNYANLKGEDVEKVVQVEAISVSPRYDISVAGAQFMSTETDSVSTVTAEINGASTIKAGQLEVVAIDGTKVSSTGSAPMVSVKLVDGESVRVETQVAKAGAREVSTTIGKNVNITTTKGDIVVLAISDLDVYTHLNSMEKYSGIALLGYTLWPEVHKTIINTTVAGKLMSSGDIQIAAQENININVDKFQAINSGLLDDATSTIYSKIDSQNVGVTIGDGSAGLIEAPHGSIAILAVSSGNITNGAAADFKGLKCKCNIYIRDEYNRNTTVNISNNTSVYAGYGILINAAARKAEIHTDASGEMADFKGKVRPWTIIDYRETTSITIGYGCDITAQLGEIIIEGLTYSDLYASDRYVMRSGFGNNDPISTINSTVNVKVDIASNNTKKTNIYGSNVTIGAIIASQHNRAYSRGECISFKTNTIAESTVNSNNNLSVNIGNVDITGLEEINIVTSVLDLINVADSLAKVEGFTGKVTGNSSIYGKTVANINVGNKTGGRASLIGRDITINNRAIDGDIFISSNAGSINDTIVKAAVEWVKGLFNKSSKSGENDDASAYNSYEFDGEIYLNLRLYCGEYAGGINILINEDGSIATTGLANPDEHISVDSDRITIHDIKRTKQGSFIVKSQNNQADGNVTYIDLPCICIPVLNIDNYTDLPLYIDKIHMVNDAIPSKEAVFTISYPYTLPVTIETGPSAKVEIISHGKGDVIFTTGEGDNGRSSYDDFDVWDGSIYIKTNGGNVYTEGKAFVVAGKFTVEGANKIGHRNGYTDTSKPFNLYMCTSAKIKQWLAEHNEYVANISLEANDSINIRITPVVFVYRDTKELFTNTRNFIIRNLKAKNVTLEIVNQLYTTMVQSPNGTGRGKNSIREYLSYGAEYDVTFWIDAVKADTLQVDVPAPRGNSTYYIKVALEGYKVQNLIQNLGDRVIWSLYNKNRTEDDYITYYGWFKFPKRDENKDRVARGTLENTTKYQDYNNNNLPATKHLRKGQTNAAAVDVGDEQTPLGILGSSMLQLLRKISNVVDFALLVSVNGVNTVIVANDVSVNSMQHSITDIFNQIAKQAEQLGEAKESIVEQSKNYLKKLFNPLYKLIKF